MGRKLSLYEIIERCNKIHNYKYDYSKVVYINNYTKIEIICPVHGSFYQTLKNHLKMHGCDKCVKEKLSKKFALTLEDFVERCNKIHNYKYDYSKVVYINSHTRVCIICPIHGEFLQKPNVHLHQKCGCPKCSNKQDMTESWIKKVLNKYPENIKYFSYNKINYVNQKIKVKIYCKKCKKYFLQVPHKHLHQNSGCSYCKKSKGERKIEYYLCDIDYLQEKKFNNCKNKIDLRFDFYLPKQNVCIEYQGEQHYKPVSFGSTNKENIENKFKKQQKRDNIKRKYCKENNIKLIEIPHWKFENIGNILKENNII